MPTQLERMESEESWFGRCHSFDICRVIMEIVVRNEFGEEIGRYRWE